MAYTMHPDRAKAEAAYKAALHTFNVVSCGSNAIAFEAAHAALQAARIVVVAAELNHPTSQERRKQNREMRLRNRGLE